MKLEELKCIKNSNIDEYLEFYKYVKSKIYIYKSTSR